MALYFAAEGGNSDKVLGLTCQHVLLETDGSTNDDYVFAGTGAPRKYVQLLGSESALAPSTNFSAPSRYVSVVTVSWLRFTRGGSRG
jgi:hypothetical protein